MNKIFNLFSSGHSLYSYRWLIVTIAFSLGIMAYFDYTGDGIFMSNQKDQQWSSGSTGRHK